LEREPEKLQGIAQALGYKNRAVETAGDFLLRDYTRRRERVRACYERRFRAESKKLSTLEASSAGGDSVSRER